MRTATKLLLCALMACASALTSVAQSSDNDLCKTVTTCPDPELIVEYGDEGEESDMSRLDLLGTSISNIPSGTGYIIVYGGRRSERGEVKEYRERFRRYLVDTRGVDAARFVIVHGGFRERLTVQMWFRHPGTCAPVPTPTVDPEDVIFKKRRRSSRPGISPRRSV